MSGAYFLYNLIGLIAGPFILGAAVLGKKMEGHWSQRFGYVAAPPSGGSFRIWVHAVSFGEVQAAASFITALKSLESHLTIWLTTSTEAGRIAASNLLPDDIPVYTNPIDFYGSPGRALDRLKPDLYVLTETELWPNMIKAASSRGVKTMMVNGRISDASISGYKKMRWLFKQVVGYLDLMGMIRETDRERIIALGADEKRTHVTGSMKYDDFIDRADPGLLEDYRTRLGLAKDQLVMVAGSTRSGEDDLVLEVFLKLRKDFPLLHLILAPRHIERCSDLAIAIEEKQLSFQKYSTANSQGAHFPDITLVDVMGELFNLYGLGNVAYCGGSLVDLGGQNPLEPAAWGVPALYGPSMYNFIDAREILEKVGAGIRVSDSGELFSSIKRLLSGEIEAEKIGSKGRMVLKSRPKSAHVLARMALDLLTIDTGP